MSRNQRLGLIALAAVVAVAAFVIAKPGDDEDSDSKAVRTTPAKTTATTETGSDTATAPEQPAVQRVVIRGGRPVGGVRRLEFQSGELARIEISSDAPDELHLHGYDITREARPGKPASFRFKANAEGSFELESHTAEHAGRDPLVARVVVAPS
jgi:hypothetical protein